jgi:hypothetical protein
MGWKQSPRGENGKSKKTIGDRKDHRRKVEKHDVMDQSGNERPIGNVLLFCRYPEGFDDMQ